MTCLALDWSSAPWAKEVKGGNKVVLRAIGGVIIIGWQSLAVTQREDSAKARVTTRPLFLEGKIAIGLTKGKMAEE